MVTQWIGFRQELFFFFLSLTRRLSPSQFHVAVCDVGIILVDTEDINIAVCFAADIDECADWDLFNCSSDGFEQCVNTYGSYKCECDEGLYKINGSCRGQLMSLFNGNIIDFIDVYGVFVFPVQY